MKNNMITVTDHKTKLDLYPMQVKSFTAMGAYTMVNALDGKQYCKCLNIGSIEKLVKHTGFFIRTHESHLVNITCINWEERLCDGTCAMIDGSRMQVARRNSNAFKKLRAKMTAGKENHTAGKKPVAML